MSRLPAPVRKWRPTLGMVVFLTLAAVLALPLVGLYFFRIDENQLIRQAEAELIAEAAMLRPVFQQAIEAGVPDNVPLGPAVTPPTEAFLAEHPYQPILPRLGLGEQPVLGPRPDARPATMPADPAFLAVGARLAPAILAAQRVTLSGFRLLDPAGVVIAGNGEIGQSLAQIPEVADALRGLFSAAMRTRILDHPAPPLYSISRGTRMRVFIAMPVLARDHVAGVIYLSRTPNNVLKQLYDQRRAVIFACLSMLAATTLIGLVFHRVIVRPVRALIRRTESIGRGEQGAMQPLRHHGTAEFVQLSQSFLGMADSLNRRSRFISSFATHVSHELKSPLAAIKGAAELLRDDMVPSDRARFLDNIAADADRLGRMADRLRELARAEAPPGTGSTTLHEALNRFAPALTLSADGALEQRMQITADDLRIVLAHLADNAVRHGATTLSITAVADPPEMRIRVADDGPGISPANRPHVFESGFTTRREAGGTGMGLVIVQAMMQSHRGGVELADSSAGAAFILSIPLAS